MLPDILPTVIQGLYDDLILHDERTAVPEGFVSDGKPAQGENLKLQIGLCSCNIPGLVKRLHEVSTPSSPLYGRFLSKEEAESYTKPPDGVVDEICKWLCASQVQFEFISPSNNRLQITLPVSKAEKIFNAKFYMYRHEETGTECCQTLSYCLPSQLDSMIESVEPTTSFPIVPTCARAPSDSNSPGRPITPSVLTALYSGIPTSKATQTNNHARAFCDSNSPGHPITPCDLTTLYGIPTSKATQTNNLLSVVGFFVTNRPSLRQFASKSDLKLFLEKYRPDLTTPRAVDFKERFIFGGKNPPNPDPDPYNLNYEGNLDIQYTVGLVNGAPVEFFSSGKFDINYWIGMANNWLCRDELPAVISISYGFPEDSGLNPVVTSATTSSIKTLSNCYAQLGARGVSILVSTGDHGVNADKDGKFQPNFPASCPYVTAVGATKGYPEVAASISGGGFSGIFTRAEAPYQEDAVRHYLDKNGSCYDGSFVREGRAYPDISAQGDNGSVAIVHREKHMLAGGTSAAAPISASIITLLNDRLLRQKGRTLGFLNPLLYANPTIMNNISEGSNPGSGIGTKGFPAKPGWDPATGLGTLNFAEMEKLILSPSMRNGEKRRDLWVKHPDGNIKRIIPDASIVPNYMVAGNYEIASESNDVFRTGLAQIPSLPPPPLGVNVANVGKGNLVFICPWIDDESFILPNGSWKALGEVDYVVYIVNDDDWCKGKFRVSS